MPTDDKSLKVIQEALTLHRENAIPEMGVAACDLYRAIERIMQMPNPRHTLGTVIGVMENALNDPEKARPDMLNLSRADYKKVLASIICVDFFPLLETGNFEIVNTAMTEAIRIINLRYEKKPSMPFHLPESDTVH